MAAPCTVQHSSRTIAALPVELWLKIFAHIDDFQSKLECRLVSRQWRTCIDDRQSWRGPHFGTVNIMIASQQNEVVDTACGVVAVLLYYGLNADSKRKHWTIGCASDDRTDADTPAAKRRQMLNAGQLGDKRDGHRRFAAFLFSRISLCTLNVSGGFAH